MTRLFSINLHFDHPTYLLKRLLYHNVLFSAHLKKWNVKSSSQILALLEGNLSLSFGKVTLVRQKNSAGLFVCVLLNIVYPALYVVVWISVRNRVCENHAVWTFVIVRSYGSESVLTCSVPQGKLNFFIVNNYGLYLKIDSNCRIMDHSEVILSKSEQNIGFSNSRISNDDHFAHVVVLFVILSVLSVHSMFKIIIIFCYFPSFKLCTLFLRILNLSKGSKLP